MKRLLTAGVAAALIAVSATAMAQPTRDDRRDAGRDCRAERGDTDASRDAFRERYGTNRNKRNAFGKCVSRGARGEERQRERAERNAARTCRAEREELGAEAFAEKHGTNRNKRNAFGKCVSALAREQEDEQEQEEQEQDEQEAGAPEEGGEAFGRRIAEERSGGRSNAGRD